MDTTDAAPNQPRCSNHCACARLDRRAFLGIASASAAALLATPSTAFAGPFEQEDFGRTAPADKKLSPEWTASLTARGVPEVYRGDDLRFIGMPIGGICAGQVYLGGDGRLWHWDVFNQPISTGADHYAHPMTPQSPVDQGFTLKIADAVRPLDRTGFADVRFRGEYPIGIVDYKDPACPVTVALEAFSPFAPLNTGDSSLPCTMMNFTLTNTGAVPVEVELTGRIENAACKFTPGLRGERHHQLVNLQNDTAIGLTARPSSAPVTPPRPDVVFETWDRDTYAPWTIEGEAFGAGPIAKSAMPQYQGDVGGDGARVVNSHATAPGGDVGGKDGATGKLIGPTFVIERDFIQFWIGGGNHVGKTCLNLVVDDKVVRSATGRANNHMALECFSVVDHHGKTAHIEIVDAERGAWGNIGVGTITFTDNPVNSVSLEDAADYGSLAIALLGTPPEICNWGEIVPLGDKMIAELGRRLSLQPNEPSTVSFVIAWNFPNLRMDKLPGGRLYAQRFQCALDVAKYAMQNAERLTRDTRLWRDTWYDSTLPYWFLDRTFLNTSILATSTCHRFTDGRFYGWEGVGCCAGTCGHVWQYAHAVARLFPDLERDTRERVDFGVGQRANGAIIFRAEHGDIPAIDAQAGAVLRALREHQMSADQSFLRRNWDNIKRAMEWLIEKDANGDGLIESNQHNTLDTDWFGPVAWLSGLYLAALAAANAMAREVGDGVFAEQCERIAKKGRRKLTKRLFDGEYFINLPNPAKPDTINSGSGCEIDQVMGQSWAWQVGLDRVLPKRETLSALRALWRYNFTPDVGPYRAVNKPGRWYAMPGEAGLLMCTFPRSDWNYDKAKGKGADWAAGYFNECMNGFEYQVAGHMIWEGMVTEGLAVARAVHDRYHGSRRNPYNEIECGDHYARSMASYGVFLAACGFEYHGPNGHIGFAPRITPERFKAAFTGAEGWGTYEQTIDGAGLAASLSVKRGWLSLRTFALTPAQPPKHVTAEIDGKNVPVTWSMDDGKLTIALLERDRINENSTLRVQAV